MIKKTLTALGLVAVILVLVLSLSHKTERASANVAPGGSYTATTTSPLYNSPAKVSLIRGGRGEFGSFMILEAGTGGGDFEFYDATTSDQTKRASSMASSTIFIGSVPNEGTVGDYPFDRVLNYGLVMVYTGPATVATTTINTR